MFIINYIKRKLAEFIFDEILILEGEYLQEAYTSNKTFPELEEFRKELENIFKKDY
jgi:hypothetical protein